MTSNNYSKERHTRLNHIINTVTRVSFEGVFFPPSSRKELKYACESIPLLIRPRHDACVVAKDEIGVRRGPDGQTGMKSIMKFHFFQHPYDLRVAAFHFPAKRLPVSFHSANAPAQEDNISQMI